MIAAARRTAAYMLSSSREALKGRLQEALCAPGATFYPRFSGRSALAEIVAGVRARTGRGVVLLPDYICNVVVKAVLAGGGTPEYYPLDERFEPDGRYVAERLERKDCAILLTASLYGADGGAGWLETEEWRARLAATATVFVADLCQDFSRVKAYSGLLPGTGGIVLVSFNDKAFPGAMGGGFLAEADGGWPADPPLEISRGRRARLAVRFALSCYGEMRRRARSRGNAPVPLGPVPPGYAPCLDFPFGMTPYRAERLQLAAACAGLDLAGRYASARAGRLKTLGGAALQTPHLDRAPYVVLCRPWNGRARQKPPYAREEEPGKSLRPGLIIVHNKGFSDE